MYIYKLLDRNENLLYIGKTKNINNRVRQHELDSKNKEWKKNIAKIEYADCYNETDMNIYEVYYINKLNPIYNQSENYNAEPSFTLKDLIFKEYIRKENMDKLESISDNELGKLYKINIVLGENTFNIKDIHNLLKFTNIKSTRRFVHSMMKIGYIVKINSKTFRIKF